MKQPISFFTRWFPKTEGEYGGTAEPCVDPKEPTHPVRLRVQQQVEADNGEIVDFGNDFDIQLTPELADQLAANLTEAAALSRHFSATITDEDIIRNQNTHTSGTADLYHEPAPGLVPTHCEDAS